MSVKTQPKLVQRIFNCNGHDVYVSLVGDCGCISITDRNLYPDDDSRSERLNLNHNSIMIPLMTREDLKDLRTAIDEVLKHSK